MITITCIERERKEKIKFLSAGVIAIVKLPSLSVTAIFFDLSVETVTPGKAFADESVK